MSTTGVTSALLLRADIAEDVASGRILGEVRKMRCTSKVGRTVYIAKAGTKTLIGQVTVSSCAPVTFEECLSLWERRAVGMCQKPDRSKTKQRFLWGFSNPVRFAKPQPYKHPRGAQIWLNL